MQQQRLIPAKAKLRILFKIYCSVYKKYAWLIKRGLTSMSTVLWSCPGIMRKFVGRTQPKISDIQVLPKAPSSYAAETPWSQSVSSGPDDMVPRRKK